MDVVDVIYPIEDSGWRPWIPRRWLRLSVVDPCIVSVVAAFARVIEQADGRHMTCCIITIGYRISLM